MECISVETGWTYSTPLDRYDLFASFPPELEGMLGYDSVRIFAYPESPGRLDFLPWDDGEAVDYLEGASLPTNLYRTIADRIPPVPTCPDDAYDDGF